MLPVHITDTANVQTWADIGVIFLLFALGLEFSFKKLLSVGKTALLTATVAVGGMMVSGFLVGHFLGWSNINCLFLGSMLAMSSTTIIIKAFNDLGMTDKPCAPQVFGVLIVEDLAQQYEDVDELVVIRLVEPGSLHDLAGRRLVESHEGIDLLAVQGLGSFLGQLFDLDAALTGAQSEVAPLTAIDQQREVVLLVDVGALGDHHPPHRVALDVHAQDLARTVDGLLGRPGELHTASLTAAAGLHLCLDGDHADIELFGDRAGGERPRRRLRAQDGNAVSLEHIPCLELVQVHVASPSSGVGEKETSGLR